LPKEITQETVKSSSDKLDARSWVGRFFGGKEWDDPQKEGHPSTWVGIHRSRMQAVLPGPANKTTKSHGNKPELLLVCHRLAQLLPGVYDQFKPLRNKQLSL
jgi:hypothetical protein